MIMNCITDIKDFTCTNIIKYLNIIPEARTIEFQLQRIIL